MRKRLSEKMKAKTDSLVLQQLVRPAFGRISAAILVIALVLEGSGCYGKSAEPSGPTLEPPAELGASWVLSGTHELPSASVRLHLNDRQWFMKPAPDWTLDAACRKAATVLVYDSHYGLMLIGGREVSSPVVSDKGEALAAEKPLFDRTPEQFASQTQQKVAGWPRFPVRAFAWRHEPSFDQKTNLGRWGFVARNNDRVWMAFSWLLFDRSGYVSVLLLSRPSDFDVTMKKLEDLAAPPVDIERLATWVPPLDASDDPAAYDTSTLMLFDFPIAVRCALKSNFGHGF
jgi:hypothetical protein